MRCNNTCPTCRRNVWIPCNRCPDCIKQIPAGEHANLSASMTPTIHGASITIEYTCEIMCSGCGQQGMWMPHDPSCPSPKPNWISVNEEWTVNGDRVTKERFELYRLMLTEKARGGAQG